MNSLGRTLEREDWLAIVGRMAPADLRLYYPGGEQAAFWRRVRESGEYREEVREIRAEAERLRHEQNPELAYSLFAVFAQRGTRLEYERVYFERRRRLNTFALLALLDPDDQVAEHELLDMIWSVCGEYTWCLPAHLGADGHERAIDLFAAETGFTLGEIALLLQGRLPRLLQTRIEAEVNRRLFEPFLRNGPYEWETARHNWAAVCAGSVGAAALLLLRDPEALSAILERVHASLECYLQGFGADGACPEGPGYWNYGFGYFVYFADLLARRTLGEADWFAGDKVRRIAEFQQKCYLGGDRVANFSDAVPHCRVQIGLSHELARRYKSVQLPPPGLRADYRDDHCSRWAPAFRNLIWKDGAAEGEQDRDWPAVSYDLPDAQWLVSRHRSAAGAFCFAAKGGHNGEPHNHNDLGHFILIADGDTFAADLGSGEYTADYFGAGRYRYDCNGSQGHSVPIINGRHQAEGERHAAVVLEAATGGTRDELRLDLTGAYEEPGLKRFTRSFVWDKMELPALELTDEFRFVLQPEALAERVVTPLRPVMNGNGEVLLARTGGGKRALRIVYDGQRLEPAAQPHTFRNHFGRDETWYSLDFIVKQPGLTERVRLKFEFV